MSAHTLGPWHWVNPDTDESYNFNEYNPRLTKEAQHKVAVGISLRTVEEFSSQYSHLKLPKFIAEAEEISREDAALIAAAPDLYDLAQACAKVIEAMPGDEAAALRLSIAVVLKKASGE